MRFDSPSQAAPARRPRRSIGRGPSLYLALVAFLGIVTFVTVAHGAAVQATVDAAHAQSGARTEQTEAGHAEGVLPVIARIFNFGVLAGVLVYFLRTPIATYLGSRSTQIRQDLVTAAEMRAAATAQLAQIQDKLKSLPAELEALRARGAEDVVAERDRIARAAAVERDRLLDHTRREIAMQLRIARRELVEYAAQLAVDVATTRIVQTITPDDQLRLVDRYAVQLKEAR
jgi:F0F1-type ATP synthase membrane subunit b/b'